VRHSCQLAAHACQGVDFRMGSGVGGPGGGSPIGSGRTGWWQTAPLSRIAGRVMRNIS